MYHVHLEKCKSTQTHLKDHLPELLSENRDTLVSSENQTEGVGRKGTHWEHFDSSVTFSFTLLPNEQMTLTSLEVGVLILKFLKTKSSDELYLKWPNDILNTDGEKCGGILSQLIDGILIVGIGLNFEGKVNDRGNFKFPIGYLKKGSFLQSFKKKLPAEIYNFILTNRITQSQVISEWNKKNFFKNKAVTIKDGTTFVTGSFLGIGTIGEALIQDQLTKKTISFVTGSLS